MTKIIVVGDLHGYTNYLQRIVDLERPDFVLQTGDQVDYFGQDCPVYFITGDDEDEEVLDTYVLTNQDIMDTYMLVNGARSTLSDLEVGGINGLSLESANELGLESYDIFDDTDLEICECSLMDIDIFMSHEPPSGLVDNFGSEELRALISIIQPRYSFSGHQHTYAKQQWGRTTMVSLPLSQYGYYALEFSGKNVIGERFMKVKPDDNLDINDLKYERGD